MCFEVFEHQPNSFKRNTFIVISPMNYSYPVDLTCDDDDDAGAMPAAAPSATVTHSRVPVVNTDVVDLTDLADSPLPQLGPRKADALKPALNRITAYFSPSPASPTKKVHKNHVLSFVASS